MYKFIRYQFVLLLSLFLFCNPKSGPKVNYIPLILLGLNTYSADVITSRVGGWALYNGKWGFWATNTDVLSLTETKFIERGETYTIVTSGKDFITITKNGVDLIRIALVVIGPDMFFYCKSSAYDINDMNRGCNSSYWTRAERIPPKG